MAEELAPSLQDSFRKHVQEHGVPVTVYFPKGVRLQGYIMGSDRFTRVPPRPIRGLPWPIRSWRDLSPTFAERSGLDLEAPGTGILAGELV
ncbi:RNA chaperone Hfq, partial [Microvirga massiliensis]|uniref:RNA chaperone Hfq n=1 Tax=Microvirga massiliensis TaxID=1033741 RepID=UPI00062BCE84